MFLSNPSPLDKRYNFLESTGFGNAAQTYTRGRPDYPPELLSWLHRELALGAGKTAVDLGAGTGKFTKLLLQTGATVIAIEPIDAMRAALAAALPKVRVITGTAQAMGLPDVTSDAVLCAPFHWFATEAALAEIHRVLKPGGKLGLVWNVLHRLGCCDHQHHRVVRRRHAALLPITGQFASASSRSQRCIMPRTG